MALASSGLGELLRAARDGRRPDSAAALDVLTGAPAAEILNAAEARTVSGCGTAVTDSRKVFIPLTQLCRDVCH